jgi:hypothetical protein
MKSLSIRHTPSIQARLRGARRELDEVWAEIDAMPPGMVGKTFCTMNIADAITALDKVILTTESH